MSANPHANGGAVLTPLDLPSYADYSIPVDQPAGDRQESTRRLGLMLRDIYVRNPTTFRLFCPDETSSNRLGAVFEVSDRCLVEPIIAIDDHVSHEGRVMEVLSEHNCEGWLEGYLLTGRHGMFASYEAFAMITASMLIQHMKWLQHTRALAWRVPISSLNVLLTSTCWRNDHNGFSHQGPGLIDTVLPMKGTVARIYLPPDANCLLSVADHCFRSRDYVNLIVIDKQPQLQYLDLEAAARHCAAGASIWEWAGNEGPSEPDVVIACAGDIPTMEALAAAWLLREHLPHLCVRFVNVVDLMTLYPPDVHPHGMSEARFVELFTPRTDVVMAFHGYPRAIHQLIHGRTGAERFHVKGYNEEGTTTTPFDMVVKNEMSRYHLCLDALKWSRRAVEGSEVLAAHCEEMLNRHRQYVVEHLDDMPEVKDWTWSPA
jgi:xylulose-5-phosphate/fructose-6-phosphate phosphoketolase